MVKINFTEVYCQPDKNDFEAMSLKNSCADFYVWSIRQQLLWVGRNFLPKFKVAAPQNSVEMIYFRVTLRKKMALLFLSFKNYRLRPHEGGVW